MLVQPRCVAVDNTTGATGDTGHEVNVADANDLSSPTCGRRPTDPLVVEYECGVRAFCSPLSRNHYENTLGSNRGSAVETA